MNADISVFIDPSSHHFFCNELFNSQSPHNLDGSLNAYLYLRELFQSSGIEVNTGDYLLTGEKLKRRNVYFSLGVLEHYKVLAKRSDVILSGLFTMEAPIVQPSLYKSLPEADKYFRRIYSFTTGEALARFGCRNVNLSKFHIPYPYSRVIEELWQKTDRKFLNLLNCNRLCRRSWQELYTERLRAVDYFAQYDEIDLYGMHWEVPPYIVGETWIPATLTRINRYLYERFPSVRKRRFDCAIKKAYRGFAVSKYLTQSNYTFTICYENMMLPGWLNENIFDCFLVGTVPIFLGPPDITDYVPAECFIDKRSFATYADLRQFLKSLSAKDIQSYRENARDYLSSALFKLFTKEKFADLFLRAVEEDCQVDLSGACCLESQFSNSPLSAPKVSISGLGAPV
jgi:hypothetical protein